MPKRFVGAGGFVVGRAGILALLVALVSADELFDADGKPVGPIVGIDLGTTYSCVGVFKGSTGRVEIIANDQGNRVTPSYVSFDDGERLVGDAAKTAAALNPSNTVYDVKRLIGREFSDPHVEHDRKLWPFKVNRDADGRPAIEVQVGDQRRAFKPQEVSAMVLGKMKDTAEAYLGELVRHAVVTVPAYFNDAQRQATKDAGTIAGLNVVRILNEPTAAAIAFGLDKQLDSSTVLVFDLGGGTFDVSLLSIDSGVFEVLATAGDTHLGGEDFDNRLIEHLVKLCKKKHPLRDPASDATAVQKLRREAERAKRALSTSVEVRVEIDSLLPGLDFSETVTRARFDELCGDLFRQTLVPIGKVLEDAGVQKEEVDELVLVGGSTRIPKVRSLLQAHFGKEPNLSVHPDEAVAYGAAVQAGILSGEKDKKFQEVLLLDVTPLTLGIETTGGVMGAIIPRNTVIPTSKSATYTTAEENQVAVTNKVYEGERSLSKDNRLLGEFELSGFPPMPKGQAQIEVSFDLDADGILAVSAREKTSGAEAKITITNKDRLTPEQVDSMVRDAESFKEADRRALARVAARTALESYVHGVKERLATDGLRGRLEEDELDSILRELRAADDWADDAASEGAEASEFEFRLEELRDVAVEPILRRYGAAAGASGGHAYGHSNEDFGSHRDHEEL